MTLRDLPTQADLEWMRDGLCRQVDPDIFFHPDKGQDTPGRLEAARKTCQACEVLSTCREWILDREDAGMREYGMWGAMTEGERTKVRRRTRRQVA